MHVEQSVLLMETTGGLHGLVSWTRWALRRATLVAFLEPFREVWVFGSQHEVSISLLNPACPTLEVKEEPSMGARGSCRLAHLPLPLPRPKTAPHPIPWWSWTAA